jgi:hypothetical protein
MSLKPSRRGLLVGMGATAADAVLPVQANTRDDPMTYRTSGELVEALAKRRVSSREGGQRIVFAESLPCPAGEQHVVGTGFYVGWLFLSGRPVGDRLCSSRRLPMDKITGLDTRFRYLRAVGITGVM